MLKSAESEIYTFKGSAETQVSFVGRAGERVTRNLSSSPALEDASAQFAAIAVERTQSAGKGSVSDRLAAMRASISKSKGVAGELGEKALGVAAQTSEQVISDETRIAEAAKRAMEKFGSPAVAVAEAGLKPLATPAQGKDGKFLA